MLGNMKRETLCELYLTGLRDLELDIYFLPLHDPTKFPDLPWSSLIRLRPITVVLNREAEDYGDAIPFGQS